METVRFTIGLAILLLIALAFKFITEPFAPDDFIPSLIEALGILVAGVIWGLMVWLPIRLIKGTDRAPDLQHFVFYTAAIFIAFLIAWHFIR